MKLRSVNVGQPRLPVEPELLPRLIAAEALDRELMDLADRRTA